MASSPNRSTLSGETKAPIETLERAKAVLESKQLIPLNQTPNIEALYTGLLHLADGTNSATVKEALCAFSTYAKSISMSALATEIREKTTAAWSLLDGQAERLEQVHLNLDGCLNNAATQVRKLESIHAAVSREVEAVVARAMERLESSAKDMVTNVTEQVKEATARGDSGEGRDVRPASYAAAVRQTLPASHATTLAREDTRAKQVLVDGAPVSLPDGTRLTEEMLLEKAKVAWDGMGAAALGAPENAEFMSVRRLSNGGVLYEMASAEAAKWLQRPDNMRAFVARYGGESTTIQT